MTATQQPKPVVGQNTAKPVAAPAPATATQPAVRKTAPFKVTSPKRTQRWLNALIYGNFGVGKTWLAGSSILVPEMRDVFMIDAESGDMSVGQWQDIDSVQISSYKQMARIYEYLTLHCRYRDAGDAEGLRRTEAQVKDVPIEEIITPRRYKTVIIDSLSEVQKYAMYQLLGIKVGDRALDVEPEQAQFAEWGKNAELIRLLVRSFRDLPMHCIIVCSELVDQDAQKQLHRRPSLPGKLGNEIQGFLDVVGYLTAFPDDEGELMRRLYLQPGRTFQAKHRFAGVNVPHLDKPTMADLARMTFGIADTVKQAAPAQKEPDA